MKSLAACLMLVSCQSWMSSPHTMAGEAEMPPSFEWAISAGGTLHDKTRGIAVDPAGNILLTGEFTGTATFGEQTLTTVGHAISGYTSGMPFGFHPDSERRVFNNLCAYTGGARQYPLAFGAKYDKANLMIDGNLHWHSDPTVPIPADYFKTSREHPLSEANKSRYPDGWDAHSLIADPKFHSFSTNAGDKVDLRLKPDSPAIGAGVLLPADWPDPHRPANSARPDIGALPAGSEPLRVGIDRRITAGDVRP